MSLRLRRVVTGHDERGKAHVVSDGVMTNILRRRPGYESTVVWSTESLPADNSGSWDGVGHDVGNTVPNGAVLRVVRYEPGVAPRTHRTELDQPRYRAVCDCVCPPRRAARGDRRKDARCDRLVHHRAAVDEQRLAGNEITFG
jgi:hypothetical protein